MIKIGNSKSVRRIASLIIIVGFVFVIKFRISKQKAFKNKSELSQIVRVNVKYNFEKIYKQLVCGHNATNDNNLTEDHATAKAQIVNDGLYSYFQNYELEKNELCPLIPPNLGPVPSDKSIIGLYGIENMYIEIVTGGVHSPTACIARQNAAIIIPLHETNNRMKSYLGSFLYYMHPFLMKQQLEYQVFVISKINATLPYKRGELFNIGFEIAQTKRPEGWKCFIFHDPHIVPEDTRNLYRCSHRPRRLIADLRRPYRFGGAVAITPEHFVACNGFSNMAWNNDDDYIDMYRRLVLANFTIEANVAPIGNFSTLEYLKQTNNETIRSQTSVPNTHDGFSNVKLNITSVKYFQLYTLVSVQDVF